MSKTIRVLIADDHPIIRQGLKVLLSTEPDLEIVGEGQDGRKAVELAMRTKPHIVLMDVAMPFLNGVTATRRILKLQPDCKVIALSTYTDDDAVKRMLDAGAVGYLTKQSAADELIRSVAPTAQRVSDAALNAAYRKKDLNGSEKQVVKLIAEGLSNKEIATQLNLSLSQMKYCRERVMDKLKVRNVADLTRFALAQGWVSLLKQKQPVTGISSKPQRDAGQSAALPPAALLDKSPFPAPRDRVAA
jgi:DNA-binding NarL/FixJ family response regulator